MVQFASTPRQRIFLISFGVALAIIVIGIAVYFGNKATRTTNSTAEESAKIPKVSITSDYSFDVNDNLAFCDRKTTQVNLLETVDDYAVQINRALATISRQGGGSVVLGQGIFPISSQILMNSNACLRGQGMLRTMLRMTPNSPPYDGAGMIRIKGSDRISIIDLTLDGARSTQANLTKDDVYGRYGLYAEKFNYLWLRGVRAINHREYGFDPHGTRAEWSHYLVMQSCVADYNGKDGFALDQTMHISLLDSAARRNDRHGVNIVTGSRDVLVDRVITDFNGAQDVNSAGCGIIAQNNEKNLQTQDIRIEDSRVSESPRGGVCISDSVNVTVSNLNATITKFDDAPCFLLRKGRDIRLINARCTARSARRISDGDSIFVDDNPNQVNHWIPQVNADSPWKNDMYCQYGILYKDVCCPKVCGKSCGVAGCGQNKMASVCCRDEIMQENRRCAKTRAPCVMDKKYLVLPDVFIDAPRAVAPGKIVASPSPIAPMSSDVTVAKPIANVSGEVQQSEDVMQVVTIDTKNSSKALPVPTWNGTELTKTPIESKKATTVDEEEAAVIVDATDSKNSTVVAIAQSQSNETNKNASMTETEIVVNVPGTNQSVTAVAIAPSQSNETNKNASTTESEIFVNAPGTNLTKTKEANEGRTVLVNMSSEDDRKKEKKTDVVVPDVVIVGGLNEEGKEGNKTKMVNGGNATTTIAKDPSKVKAIPLAEATPSAKATSSAKATMQGESMVVKVE